RKLAAVAPPPFWLGSPVSLLHGSVIPSHFAHYFRRKLPEKSESGDLRFDQVKSACRKSRRVTLPRVGRAGDVTGLLQAWMQGDPDALAELSSVVHYELRQMAKRMLAGGRAAQTWQPTD